MKMQRYRDATENLQMCCSNAAE